MESISCQNQLILDAWRRYFAMKGRFSCPGPLRECIATRYCHDLPLRNALRLDLAKEGAFRQHANTQRRFLARLHPMLTRKRGCRTKAVGQRLQDKKRGGPHDAIPLPNGQSGPSDIQIQLGQSDVQVEQCQSDAKVELDLSDTRINRSQFDIRVRQSQSDIRNTTSIVTPECLDETTTSRAVIQLR